jgi:hypothetical protein
LAVRQGQAGPVRCGPCACVRACVRVCVCVCVCIHDSRLGRGSPNSASRASLSTQLAQLAPRPTLTRPWPITQPFPAQRITRVRLRKSIPHSDCPARAGGSVPSPGRFRRPASSASRPWGRGRAAGAERSRVPGLHARHGGAWICPAPSWRGAFWGRAPRAPRASTDRAVPRRAGGRAGGRAGRLRGGGGVTVRGLVSPWQAGGRGGRAEWVARTRGVHRVARKVDAPLDTAP